MASHNPVSKKEVEEDKTAAKLGMEIRKIPGASKSQVPNGKQSNTMSTEEKKMKKKNLGKEEGSSDDKTKSKKKRSTSSSKVKKDKQIKEEGSSEGKTKSNKKRCTSSSSKAKKHKQSEEGSSSTSKTKSNQKGSKSPSKGKKHKHRDHSPKRSIKQPSRNHSHAEELDEPPVPEDKKVEKYKDDELRLKNFGSIDSDNKNTESIATGDDKARNGAVGDVMTKNLAQRSSNNRGGQTPEDPAQEQINEDASIPISTAETQTRLVRGSVSTRRTTSTPGAVSVNPFGIQRGDDTSSNSSNENDDIINFANEPSNGIHNTTLLEHQHDDTEAGLVHAHLVDDAELPEAEVWKDEDLPANRRRRRIRISLFVLMTVAVVVIAISVSVVNNNGGGEFVAAPTLLPTASPSPTLFPSAAPSSSPTAMFWTQVDSSAALDGQSRFGSFYRLLSEEGEFGQKVWISDMYGGGENKVSTQDANFTYMIAGTFGETQYYWFSPTQVDCCADGHRANIALQLYFCNEESVPFCKQGPALGKELGIGSDRGTEKISKASSLSGDGGMFAQFDPVNRGIWLFDLKQIGHEFSNQKILPGPLDVNSVPDPSWLSSDDLVAETFYKCFGEETCFPGFPSLPCICADRVTFTPSLNLNGSGLASMALNNEGTMLAIMYQDYGGAVVTYDLVENENKTGITSTYHAMTANPSGTNDVHILGTSLQVSGDFIAAASTISNDHTVAWWCASLAFCYNHNHLGFNIRAYDFSLRQIGNTISRGGNWTLPWISLRADYESKGLAFAANGTILAVSSAYFERRNSHPVDDGPVYLVDVYQLDGNETWVPMGSTLGLGDDSQNILFGYSVALSEDGSTLVVGTPNALDEEGVESGMVQTFQFDPYLEDWVKIGNDIFGPRFSYFGASLSVLGNDRMVVGAPRSDGHSPGLYFGQMFVYQLVGA